MAVLLSGGYRGFGSDISSSMKATVWGGSRRPKGQGPEPLTQGLTFKSAGVPSPTRTPRPERAGSQWKEGSFGGEMIGPVPLNSCVTLDGIPTFLSLSLTFVQ